MTLADQSAAVIALLAEASPRAVHSVGTVPTPRPAEYIEVLVTERYTPEDALLLDATTDLRGYRATVWWLSKVSEANALILREKAFDALRFARITATGTTSSPAQYEGTEETVTPIDGYFVGSADFTY